MRALSASSSLLSSHPVGGVRAWASPSFAILIFICLPAGLLLKPDTMLTDPGMGWHLKTGEYIWSTGQIPQHDLFSFTLAEASWTTYEWLFQALAALLVGIGGLPLLSMTSALAYGVLPVLLYRKIARETSNVAVAAVLAFWGFAVLMAHAHARPHIVTYLFFFLLADRLARFDRGEVGARSLLWFLPLTLLWTNVHGGFVVGPILVGLYFAGSAVKAMLSDADARDLGKLRTYGVLGIGMGLVSLINPAGWDLHFSILRYLTSESLSLMVEYQSPFAILGGPALIAFEVLILALFVSLWTRRAALDVTEVITLLFFLHFSLTAARHVFLFVLVALPLLGREIAGLIEDSPRLRGWFEAMADRQRAVRSDVIYFPLVTLALIILSLSAPSMFREDLDDIYLSRGAAEMIASDPARFGRIFNTPSLGGALVYRFWPEVKIFGDDRNDFYGDDFYMNEYFHVLAAKSDWQDILDKYMVTSAVVLREDIAAELFRLSPEWRLVHQDEQNEVFVRAN